MILRLSGADFSANNIGKININRELTQETIELLSHYTRELTKDQKYAVQEFIDELKASGLWANIGNLYMPVLAGSLEESMYNIKTNTLDTTPSSEYYLLEENGIRVKQLESGTVVPTEQRAIVKMNASYMNLHYAVYIADKTWGVPNSTNTFATSFGNSAYKGILLSENSYNNTWMLNINGNPAKASNTPSKSNIGETVGGFLSVSTNSDGLCIGRIANSTSGQYTATETTDTTMTDVPTFIGCTVQGYASCLIPMKMISMGTGMSAEQLAKYNEICNKVMTVLLA